MGGSEVTSKPGVPIWYTSPHTVPTYHALQFTHDDKTLSPPTRSVPHLSTDVRFLCMSLQSSYAALHHLHLVLPTTTTFYTLIIVNNRFHQLFNTNKAETPKKTQNMAIYYNHTLIPIPAFLWGYFT